MEIEILNSMGRYVQKSNVFLYPFLKLPVKPLETYLKFKGVDLPDERLLIGLFWSEDPEYKKYKNNIEKCRYYDHTFIDDVFHIITFDLSTLKDEYDKIIKGQYSKTSDNFKLIVGHNTKDEAIKKSLYPDLNYKAFAEALDCDPELLKGKELLSPPQDSAEELHVTKDIKKEIEYVYS